MRLHLKILYDTMFSELAVSQEWVCPRAAPFTWNDEVKIACLIMHVWIVLFCKTLRWKSVEPKEQCKTSLLRGRVLLRRILRAGFWTYDSLLKPTLLGRKRVVTWGLGDMEESWLTERVLGPVWGKGCYCPTSHYAIHFLCFLLHLTILKSLLVCLF